MKKTVLTLSAFPLLVLAHCGGGTTSSADAGSDGGALPTSEAAVGDAGLETAVSDASLPPEAAVEAGGSTCNVDSDCRAFSNYCGGCTCDALGASDPNPTCDAGLDDCLRDPCADVMPVCTAHRCGLIGGL